MAEKEYEGVGYRMYRYRCNARMTRQELANAIGVSLQKLVSFERGLELPTELEMLKISKVLRVHWDNIIFPGVRNTMYKLVVQDKNTDISLVFMKYDCSVEVYLESKDTLINDIMENNYVIQTYDHDTFKELFPVQAKELFNDVQD